MARPIVPLIAAIASARKAVQLYPPAHPTFCSTIDSLEATAEASLAEGPFALNLHEGRLYEGSNVVTDEAPAAVSLSEAMWAKRIESIVFEPGFDRSDALGLVQVLNLRPRIDLQVQSELESRGVAHVRVSSLTDEDAEKREDRDRRREADRSTYHKLVATLRSISSRLVDGEQVDLATASPVVQSVIARLVEDEAAVLGMATINSGSEADLLHAVNVMIYTLNLGVSLGIPEAGLSSLGLAALVHDIGKAAFDRDDPEQRRAAEVLHPTVGAELLSRIAENEGTTAMLVAYEHHMGLDGSGLPEREPDYIAHPYSRIVAIANRYDRLSKAGYEGAQRTPDRAVMCLLGEAGSALDPFLTRLFIRAIGVFPVGCVVRLSDHSVGAVCSRGASPLEPTVRLIFDPKGAELASPVDIDLAEDERSIVEVVDEAGLGLNVSDYL